MAYYYFHTRDNGETTEDDIGLDLPDFSAVKVVAAKSLAELALDVLPGSEERCLGVEVDDAHDQRVLTTELLFKVIVPAGSRAS